MDSSIVHSGHGGSGRRACARRTLGFILGAAAAWAVAMGAPAAFAAQPVAPAAAAPTAKTALDPDKLYIDADELTYDKDRNVVTAIGGVVLYYKNRILQADKVVYDRAAKRVLAEGRTKFTDERGNITYAPKFDLTDDFASGFAEGVQALNTDKTRLSASRVERTAGTVTTFTQGAYTACEPCKAHPDWPPEWQVRAGKIIEDQQTHTVYFENAWMDIYGVPVAYLPYFSAPDPSVTRQSGFLMPQYSYGTAYGYGVGVPYFLALAPNYDLTIAPMYFSGQGGGGDLIWRHRLENGDYSITLSGVDQSNPGAFGPPPGEAGNLKFRGSAQSVGKFYLNDKWTVGWDLTALTDRWYINDYKLMSIGPAQYYFQDIVSSAYLRGQDGRGFFDLSGYYFESTLANVDQRQDPWATPVFDYHRTFAIDPTANYGLGGELSVEANAANVNRTEALYQSVGLQRFDTSYNDYGVCATYTPGTTSNNCLLRGIAGDYSRATAQVAWQTKYVDPIGEVWQPFVFARASGEATELDTSSAYTYGSGVAPTNLNTIPNYAQPAFFNGLSSGSAATGMAGIGLEYRYPFVSNSIIGQQTIQPIAQLIVRPDEVVPKLQPNEDAQSLVFDDTSLFAWSKYSGFDRVEGGTRLNYGLQYTDNFADGGHTNFVAGQSIQVAGENSYTIADAANTGFDSGLDKRFSNYVAGETLQPFSSPISIGAKQQFDSSNFSLARVDALVGANAGGWSTTIDYARYAAQPLLGWLYPREGVTASAAYNSPFGLKIGGGVQIDMSRHYYDVPGENTSIFLATGYNVSLEYDTTCTNYQLLYRSSVSDPLATTVGQPPTQVRDQTFLFTITFKTLGDVIKGLQLYDHRLIAAKRMTATPLALTMGDPAGIGPELILRAWIEREAVGATFFALADPASLATLARRLGLEVPVAVAEPGEVERVFDRALPVVPLAHRADARPGAPSAEFAAATIESIERAVGYVGAGAARAVVTNPIAKKTLYEAGFAHPGHTEFLGELARAWGGRAEPVMMIWSSLLAVVPVTIHIRLSDVPARLTRALIVSTARVVDADMKSRFGLARPRLAVAGLNPHAGEGGAMGREEIETIGPAIDELKSEGLDIMGPLPADTMFHAVARARYDVALTMYHDQGLIPAKTLAFDEGVNVTLGLPFVRTSPDHGTAFDIAGQGRANPSSLIAALKLAARLQP